MGLNLKTPGMTDKPKDAWEAWTHLTHQSRHVASEIPKICWQCKPTYHLPKQQTQRKKKKRQSCTQSLTVLPNLGPTWIRNVADCNPVGKEAFIQNFLDIKLPVTVQPSQVPNTSLLQPNSNENLCNESSTTQFFTYCSRFAIKY